MILRRDAQLPIYLPEVKMNFRLFFRTPTTILLVLAFLLSSTLSFAQTTRQDFVWSKVSYMCDRHQPMDVAFVGGAYKIPLMPRKSLRDCDVIVEWELKDNYKNTAYGRSVMQQVQRRGRNLIARTDQRRQISTPMKIGPWKMHMRVRFDLIAGHSAGFFLQYNSDIQVTADPIYRRFVRVNSTLSLPANTGLPYKHIVDHVIPGDDLLAWANSMGYATRVRTDDNSCIYQFYNMVSQLGFTCEYDLFVPEIRLNPFWSYGSAQLEGNARFKNIMIQPRKGERKLYFRVTISGKGRLPGASFMQDNTSAALRQVILQGPEGVDWRTAIGRR